MHFNIKYLRNIKHARTWALLTVCLGTRPADQELFREDSRSSSSVLDRRLDRPECDIVKLEFYNYTFGVILLHLINLNFCRLLITNWKYLYMVLLKKNCGFDLRFLKLQDATLSAWWAKDGPAAARKSSFSIIWSSALIWKSEKKERERERERTERTRER